MTVLTVNAGSSSLRLAVFTGNGHLVRLAEQRYETTDPAGPEPVREFLRQHAIPPVTRVAHRVVHGGPRLVRPCVIDAAVEHEIGRAVPLAPLHNPSALAGIRACREVLGAEVPQVAVFDTAFFADLPEVARTYALPHELCAKYGIRRYGFHGIAHQAMWRRWRTLRPDIAEGGRVVSFQLGAGCSVAAIRDGRAIDTSMGFTPLEGLVMATRSGDVDPGLLLYLQRAEGLSPERLEALLSEQSGLSGVSGLSGDMRVLLESDEPAARLAVEHYCHRARKYLGAYLALLGGADAILFGGGVGENAPFVREKILTNMEWAGIELDAARNAAAVSNEACVNSASSRIAAWVIPVDEATVLAQEAVALAQATGRETDCEID